MGSLLPDLEEREDTWQWQGEQVKSELILYQRKRESAIPNFNPNFIIGTFEGPRLMQCWPGLIHPETTLPWMSTPKTTNVATILVKHFTFDQLENLNTIV